MTQPELPLRIRAAAEAVDITPPLGIALHNWSYSPHAVSTGVHRPLFASLLALGDDGGGRCLLVSLDLGWWMNAADEASVRDHLLAVSGLAADQLILALTHTHAGPSITRADGKRPGGALVGPYLDELIAALSGAAGRLLGRLQPALLDWVTGRCSLAVNRDLLVSEQARYVVGTNENGATDDTLIVGRVTSECGDAIATVVDYAAHPTSLGGLNALISPDFLGRARELVQEHTGGTFVFLQGASGDLAPRRQYAGDPAVADRNGEILGYAVLSSLSAMDPVPGLLSYQGTIESGAPLGMVEPVPAATSGVIRHRALGVELRVQDNSPPASPEPSVEADRRLRASRVRSNVGADTTILPVTIWTLGETVIIAYPGEAYSELQRTLRTRFPEQRLLLVNLANGAHQGYIAPRAAYADGRYPAWQSPLAEGSFERLLEVITHELDRSRRSPTEQAPDRAEPRLESRATT